MSRDLDAAVEDLNQATREFGIALGKTAPGRVYLATCHWLLAPKPLNRAALLGLFAVVTCYVGGSIVLTVANL